MRYFTVLILFVVLSFSFAPRPAAVYTLEEAINKGLVEITITGVDVKLEEGYSIDSTAYFPVASNYGPCISLDIENKSSKNLKLKLENGRMLASNEKSTQNMVVTREELITLSPAQNENYHIYAMCTELSDDSPDKLSSFNLGIMSDEDLKGMTTLIEKFDEQNSDGQNAVWVITDDLYAGNLSFSNPEAEKSIKAYAVSVVGDQSDYKVLEEEYEEEEPESIVVREIEGTFDFTLINRSMVTLILFDPKGNVAREFYKGQTMEGAEYDIEFSAGSAQLQPGIYTMKLWVDQKLVKTTEYVVE